MSAKLVATIARMPHARSAHGRVLARRTGAEVVADEQDLAAGVVRLIDEGRRDAACSVRREAPVEEEGVGEVGLVGDLEESGRADLVRVDVRARDRR